MVSTCLAFIFLLRYPASVWTTNLTLLSCKWWLCPPGRHSNPKSALLFQSCMCGIGLPCGGAQGNEHSRVNGMAELQEGLCQLMNFFASLSDSGDVSFAFMYYTLTSYIGSMYGGESLMVKIHQYFVHIEAWICALHDCHSPSEW